MTRPAARFVALAAALVPLAGCDGAGSPSTGAAPDEFAPIRAQLRREALDGVTWQRSTDAPATVDGTWRTYGADTTWTWQLQGDVDVGHDADVYVVDLFAHVDGGLRRELDALGRDAFCYFSVGTWEPYRPDEAFLPESVRGEPHGLYPDERWLDVASDDVVRVMVNRLDMARAVGCDGVELDNLDAYVADGVGGAPPTAPTGFDVTRGRQIDYARTLADEAHRRGLAVALKNGSEILPELVDWFDVSIVEECHQFGECADYAPMLDAGKPVFNAEYLLFDGAGKRVPMRDASGAEVNASVGARTGVPDLGAPGVSGALDALCAKAEAAGTRTLLLPLALDGTWRRSCDG